MLDRTVVLCTDCGKAYSARKHEDSFILPTQDGHCSCGNVTVEEIEKRKWPRTDRDVPTILHSPVE